jgi:ABC-type branched-subunit amino acid transport system ATPase component
VSSSANEGPIVLQISSLSKFYGEQPALEGVGCSLRAGEVFGLIGPNGAKTDQNEHVVRFILFLRSR